MQDAYRFEQNWWEGQNLTLASVPVPTFQCSSTPTRFAVFSAVEKPPRPALRVEQPLAPTDYEVIMGVKPESVDPAKYHPGNRFSVMHRNSRKGLRDATDGVTHTFMVVECAGRPQVFRRHGATLMSSNDQGIGWADSEGPFSLDLSNSDGSREGCTPAKGCLYPINRRNDNEPFSFHSGGMNALFVDGRVEFVTESVDPFVAAALCTAGAGENISGEAY